MRHPEDHDLTHVVRSVCTQGAQALHLQQTNTTGGPQVVFRLHESFRTPLREVSTQPFELTEQGWGEFDIVATVRCGHSCCCASYVCTPHSLALSAVRSTLWTLPASSRWTSCTSCGCSRTQTLASLADRTPVCRCVTHALYSDTFSEWESFWQRATRDTREQLHVQRLGELSLHSCACLGMQSSWPGCSVQSLPWWPK